MSASQSKTDMVMKFTDKNGKEVLAESNLLVAKGDDMMSGFRPAMNADYYSNFFEVTAFNFALALHPQDQGISKLSQAAKVSMSGTNDPAPAAQDQFSRWRSATKIEYPLIRFPVQFDTFSFTRVIDSATPILFKACCNQDSLQSASLVKRIATGDGEPTYGYMRLDFSDIMLTGMNWDDGDMVTESCTFICKVLTVKYSQQRFSGELLPPGEATWDQNKNGQQSGLT